MKTKYALACNRDDGGYEILSNSGMAIMSEDLEAMENERKRCAQPDHIIILEIKERN
jgi:hypothetical protein